MLKKILTVFLFLFLSAFATDKPIEAGIKYNETTARIEAFKDIDKKLDKDFFKDYLKDKNKKENIEAIENKNFVVDENRLLCPFYLKETLISYAVRYFDKSDVTFYYNILGNLVKIEILKGNDYPKKSIGYTRYGNLISVSFEVDDNEQFIYNKDGKLIAHWIDDKITNETKGDKLLNKYNFRRGKY